MVYIFILNDSFYILSEDSDVLSKVFDKDLNIYVKLYKALLECKRKEYTRVTVYTSSPSLESELQYSSPTASSIRELTEELDYFHVAVLSESDIHDSVYRATKIKEQADDVED